MRGITGAIRWRVAILMGLALILSMFFSKKAEAQPGAPFVVSTSPANGATDVPGDQTVISITFSEPMNRGYSITNMTGNWSPIAIEWSSDSTTIFLTRPIGQDLTPGTQVTLILNYQGSTSFCDLEGNPLPAYSLSFTIVQDPQAPVVVSTNPVNGATDVSRDLLSFSITFSKPMRGGTSSTSNWGTGNIEWSADQTTVTFVRTDAQRLGAGVTVTITLSPPGYPPYEDLQGNPLPTYTLSFTTETGYQLLKIEADPVKGFHWPYYLSIPDSLGPATVLLVEPNNSGTWSDDPAFHDAKAYDLIRWHSGFAVDLDVPLLVPTFPRPITPQAPEPGGIYTHALDRYSLNLPYLPENLTRIDLQLVAMINDARERLAALGHQADAKSFFMGFSASGAFVSRFTILHPELVKAVAPGSPGGWPTAPLSEWQGITLKYPVGVADVEQLIGVPFDLNTYRNVPKYVYVGDQDTNDALDVRGMTQTEKDQICALLNCSPNPLLVNRWPIAEAMYESAGVEAQFVVYPGIAHSISTSMWSDLMSFFRQHKSVFSDVLTQHWAHDYIMGIYNAGITGGCSDNPRQFCPDQPVTRGQMAVFIEAALGHPANTCSGRFTDVAPDDPFCGFIERLADDGITGGCRDNDYCPDAAVTRSQMAVFIEAALGNSANVCAGRFGDVSLAHPFCGFIERLADDGITGGCGGANFCPDLPVTRAQMAVFLMAAPDPLIPGE
jgi:hypothetical protein